MLSNNIFKNLFILFILFLTSCASNKPFYSKSALDWEKQFPADSLDVVYSLYLIGNSRSAYLDASFLSMMESHLNSAVDNSAVLFLGDNVQPDGLPDSTHRSWDVAHKSLMAQLEILQNFKGEIFFIPGNHDWARGKKEGLEYVRNQRKYIESSLNRKNSFLPKQGRPGPVEVHLTEDIVIIIIDSHWWFHENEKSYAGIEDEADFFVQIEDAISRNRNKKIIFAANNPLFSVGNHGGHFKATDNLFPLLNVSRALYIPLPGFIYTAYRKFLGYNQDLSHPQYKLLKEALLETFEGHSNIIYAAGHEHNLQYVERDSIHHIISGAAGVSSYVAHNEKTDFAQMQNGFAKLEFLSNGDVWLEFHTTTEGLTFRKKIFNKPRYEGKVIEQFLSDIDYSDSTITTYPKGEKYHASALKRLFLGNNYREEWLIPVEVPVFDFNYEKGGLEIVKKGGGAQTKSLRLENSHGQQWVLRSIEKDPSKAVPEIVKMQLAIDLAQDQMSAYLPWAALSVPRLADAAEIYHTNPKIVYLTKDPRLGAYKDDVWEGLYLFEERPNGNRKDVESFGRSKEIIGTPDMFDEITEDHSNQMDQGYFLKSRLFDVYIGDWDRHEDQWRWAGFKEGDKMLYRAIPRDRDQTFFLNEGFFPWIASRKFALRINQGFKYDIKDMGGLISQARWLDRRFLSELTKKDWIKAAEKMQAALSDELITASINDMPAQITEFKGNATIDILKTRRDKLPEFAAEYYSIISKKVDIVGSDKREHFQVKRLNNKETEVKVWSVSSKNNKKDKIYDRKFKNDETSEIRLYGLKGQDEFDVGGKVDNGMKVRIIGGPGKDDIKDKSEVRGLAKRTIVYDTKKKNDIEFGKEARNRTSDNPEKNRYTYAAFNYNKLIPIAYLGFNADEALIVGAGLMYTIYGFQKSPYASYHSLGANYASATRALKLKYDGVFTSLIGGLDLNMHIIIQDPKYTQNFFGLGNESIQLTDNKDFNRVRIGEIYIHPELSKTINFNTFSAGLFYQKYNVENTDGRFISDLSANGLDPEIFESQNYAGINVRHQIDTRNSTILPTRGIYWNTNASFLYDLDHATKTFNRLSSDLSLFMSFRKPHRMVIALRIGGSMNIGEYDFFQANTLGGESNLRGYRSTRYSGDANIYQNSEFRFKLFEFSSYFAKGEFGIIGFNDVGRIWLDGENSDMWHHGYGGGIWISPFNISVISATFERSKDEENGLFSLQFKYLF